MMKNWYNALMVVMAAVGILATPAGAASNAVIIQAYLPEEARELDWGPDDVDTLDELWNDCFLLYELLYRREVISGDTDRIHMLWGEGEDYPRQGWRYSPWEQLQIQHDITDDSACIASVDSVFAMLAETMAESDTFFCYTWGHGGCRESQAV